jgi:hypothetical protein
MYTQNQQYQQSLQTSLFGNDTIGKVTNYLKSHLSPKPSLQARLRGKAKSLEDFANECKRRGIKEVWVHSPGERYRGYTPIFVGAESSPDNKVNFRKAVSWYDYRDTRYPGDLLGEYIHFDEALQEEEKTKLEWKQFLENQGFEVHGFF